LGSVIEVHSGLILLVFRSYPLDVKRVFADLGNSQSSERSGHTELVTAGGVEFDFSYLGMVDYLILKPLSSFFRSVARLSDAAVELALFENLRGVSLQLCSKGDDLVPFVY